MRFRRQVAAGVGVILVAVMAPATSAAEDPGASAPAGPMLASGGAVTLLTGDRLWAEPGEHGQWQVTVDPAPRDGTASFQQYQLDGELYVIPSDAAPLIGDVLDRELFNVTKLLDYGYTEGIPVIARHRGGGQRALADGSAATLTTTGMSVTADLPSIGGVAATVDVDGSWWRQVRPADPAGIQTASAPLAGVDRVWLDGLAEVTLDQSAPQVGAPAAWAAGFDGTGMTVAVLDTGIDDTHPDLAGKVALAENFTDEPDGSDGHGHGTHVAGTVAGTAAASGGDYLGVAPGAEVLNAKVCTAAGSCPFSAIIAGMEWAAPRADVVNMSLGGGGANDGTDPISLALNQLTAAHDVLFVVSAGNSGPQARTITSPAVADAALAVGAVTKQDALANFSSRGPRFGDWAIKPDLTAPGAEIVAARGAGTSLGSPVDDHYTSLSGTSMAAPHVAAAAAILRQRDPDLSPADLKAALVTSAEPNPDLTVYQQGGGRLDIAAALASPVLVSPAPLDLGHFLFPHDDADPVHSEVTVTNRGTEPLTLELSLDVRSDQGDVPPEQMLSLQPATLELAPGESATTTITLDVREGENGLYGGYLIARTSDETVARAPVGFHKEAEAYEITIHGIGRDGNPATGAMAVLDVENMSRFLNPGVFFLDGVARTRVPPGVYSVLGAIDTHDLRGQYLQARAFVGDPEVTVTADTTLTFDARDANRITVETPTPDAVPQGGVSLGYWRTAAQPGPLFNPTWLVQPSAVEYYAMPMAPATAGGFEFYSRWQMAEPEALLDVVEPAAVSLDPHLLRPPAVAGEHHLPLVDAGQGSAADFADVDVAGAVALVQRGPVPHVEQEQHAAAAGAAALVVTNDVPGKLTGSLIDGAGTIPTLSLTQQEGQELRDLLAGGEVTVRLAGTAWSPYVYHLPFFEAEGIPEDLAYVVAAEQLATVEVAYHSDVADHPMSEARHFSRPFHSGSTLLHPPVVGPQTRTEYLTGDLEWQQTVHGENPFEARLREPNPILRPAGETSHRSWFRQVLRPALLPEVDPTTRSGDTLHLSLFEWVDTDGNHFPNQIFGITPYAGDTVETRLWRGDTLIGEITGGGFPRGQFPMVAQAADYRIVLDVTREADWWNRSTSTSTEWTFTSPGTTTGAEPLPLLSVNYRADLDLRNTAPHPRDRRGPSTLELDVYQQDAGLPAVAGARAWISYDDGDTWRARPVRATGDGQFTVNLSGASPAGSEAISVRVEAWDTAGNRVEQEVIRAWLLAPAGS